MDEKSHGLRESVYLPLYPLAEWIACNWWMILSEPLNPKRVVLDRYLGRHSIISAGEGYALPFLSFQSEGEEIHVTWSARQHPWAKVRFVEGGGVYLPKAVVETALGEFVSAVAKRLDDEKIGGTLLQDEWSALQTLDTEEQQFCLAAGKLGRDPFNLSEAEKTAIVGAADSIAEKLGVSEMVVRHQLLNHRIVPENLLMWGSHNRGR